MSPAFLAAWKKSVDSFEGGFVNNPLDRGGATYHGVTQRTYDAFRKTVGKPLQSVELMSDLEERVIYHDDYWLPINGDALPEPLSHAVFDMAINSGVYNAKLTLQSAVRVQQDSVIGPQTVAACKAMPNVLLAFLEKRAAFIRDIVQERPSQVAFLLGWIKRLLRQAYEGAK